MRYIEYHKLALRTESKPLRELDERELLNHRLGHAVLGVHSEFAELKDKEQTPDWLEEFGDLFWYLNLACDSVGTTLDELEVDGLEPDLDCLENIIANFGWIADQVKRSVYYTTETRIVEVDKDKVMKLLAQCRLDAETLCSDYDLEFEDVLDRNIEKLSARYPDKFNTDHAIDRNIAKEKAALRGDDLDEPLPEKQQCEDETCESCQ